MIYDGMWDHLAGRSFLLNYFGQKQAKHDGWADQADLMIDAFITKEYYRQFLKYVGKEEVYTELVRPTATSIVTLFTPILVRGPDVRNRILCFKFWNVPFGIILQKTHWASHILSESNIVREIDHDGL